MCLYNINFFKNLKNPLEILFLKDLFFIFYEEIVFRMYFFRNISFPFNNSLIIIFLNALFFTFVHRFFSLLQLIEFICFSLYISYIFYRTQNFLLVLLIHLLRNYIISSVSEGGIYERNKK
ncbi:CPBP family intramembrane glutamic endopeptidase [Fusobacterium necrophorum]|uniref:CPBP family intramembrane glutamic endopeptidase n=1 Tax=Fusobacterium necrophorum TaxID=859 RepID=UPI0034DEEDDD